MAKFQNMHDSRQLMAAANLASNQSNTKLMGVKQETSTSVNNQTPGVGTIGNNTLQNATPLNSYQNMLRSSSANPIFLQQEASSVFKGPTAMHNGIQLEAARSFRGPNQVQFQHPASFQQPMLQQNNFQGFGVNPQYQQHVLNQLLQEVKNNNNRTKAQQPPPDAPNASGGLASGVAIPNVAATGEQGQHINNNNSNHNGTVKGAAPAGTGPSNVINNSTASIAPGRNNSFKSVSSSPAAAAATAGNAVNSMVDDSFLQLEDLDDTVTNALVESGLFGAGQGW
jgi:hypothetical protein